MARSKSPFPAHPVGPPQFGRVAIRRNFFEPQAFYTGNPGDAWSADLRRARLYAGVDDLHRDLHEVAMRELAHLPLRGFRLEVEVTVIGKVTDDEVRQYLADALRVRLDEEHHGPGPGRGSLVLVKVDEGSLRPGNSPRADPTHA